MVKINLGKTIFVGAALCLLAACSTPSESVSLDTGGRGYRITCGGAYSSTGDCYEKAGLLCGSKGYTTVNEIDISPPADSSYFWNAAAHEVVIKCNPAMNSGMNSPMNSGRN